MNKLRTILILTLALAVLAGCATSQQPAVEPTMDPLVLTQAYQQISTQFAETQAAMPTPTEEPKPVEPTPTEVPPTAIVVTAIPTATAFPTNTAVPPLPTLKPTIAITATPSNYSCGIVSVAPAYETKFDLGYDFDAHFVVKNTGLKTWDLGETDYYYIEGDKIQKKDIYDVTTAIKSGESVDLVVDMLAPSKVGTYTTTWGLRTNGKTLCTFTVKIFAEN